MPCESRSMWSWRCSHSCPTFRPLCASSIVKNKSSTEKVTLFHSARRNLAKKQKQTKKKTWLATYHRLRSSSLQGQFIIQKEGLLGKNKFFIDFRQGNDGRARWGFREGNEDLTIKMHVGCGCEGYSRSTQTKRAEVMHGRGGGGLTERMTGPNQTKGT